MQIATRNTEGGNKTNNIVVMVKILRILGFQSETWIKSVKPNNSNIFFMCLIKHFSCSWSHGGLGNYYVNQRHIIYDLCETRAIRKKLYTTVNNETKKGIFFTRKNKWTNKKKFCQQELEYCGRITLIITRHSQGVSIPSLIEGKKNKMNRNSIYFF